MASSPTTHAEREPASGASARGCAASQATGAATMASTPSTVVCDAGEGQVEQVEGDEGEAGGEQRPLEARDARPEPWSSGGGGLGFEEERGH